MKPSLVTLCFLLTLLGTACATRRATYSAGYVLVMEKVAQWEPAKIARHEPRPVGTREEIPGELYKRWILESGGDPKFGPTTFVQVRRIDNQLTEVKLSTTKAVCYGLLGDRHVCVAQRKRWKELRAILIR